MPLPHAEPSPPTVTSAPRIQRWVLATLGVFCVGAGAIGVFVPGLPTTVFLIIASWCFVRSCPWLQEKLLHNRLFAPYLHYVNGSAVMPMKARVSAILMMWACIGVSLLWLGYAGALSAWLLAGVVAAGTLGTVVILRYRRARNV